MLEIVAQKGEKDGCMLSQPKGLKAGVINNLPANDFQKISLFKQV